MIEPFIYVSNPDELHYAESSESRGIQVTPQQGCHAIFAARVPFIPSFLTSDFTRSLVGGELSRITLITSRQVRFLNDLINARTIADGSAAFDLRFITQPPNGPEHQSSIEIVFLGKVFHPNRNRAKNLCWQLWRKFRSHYPMEDPFNYPLEPVVDEPTLMRYLLPIPIEQVGTEQLVELRKFEDFDPYAGDNTTGYFPHPFSPVVDASAFGRFLETLAQQDQPCVVSICLQPTALFHEELLLINQLLSRYRNLTIAADDQSWINAYRSERFEDLRQSFLTLINKRNHLYKIKIQVLGERYAPNDVLEALGSELIQNSSSEPRQWAREAPANETDLGIARYNFAFLEQGPWGSSRVGAGASRLRYLVSAHQATGAFRLPIPPESGYLPGLEVRDEPFVLPKEQPPVAGKHVEMGEIMHRGRPTGQMFRLSVRELTRHGLIAGSTGTGKTNTCLHLLSQLWRLHRVPFLVMYPIDKPDYRILMADPSIRSDLQIFTLGDENTSPFRFNPFAVADGVLLRTHISLLMRCFTAAFSMSDPLPAVYRAAIRQVYQSAGWDVVNGVGGTHGVRTPTMADFYDTLVTVAHEMTKDYGREVQGNVRQASEIRIRDLLSSLGSVINTSAPAPLAKLLTAPTVMELGRVGSADDTALLMGFLLMLLAEQLQSNHRTLTHEQRKEQIHITLVEEAHRLMSAGSHGGSEFTADPRAKGGEDFSNLLAEVRGFGEGILIAEQIPTTLVQGAIGNTFLKVMHWVEDQGSFELFSDIMNLDDRQRTYARRLKAGEVIVRDNRGRPIHVQVTNYLDSFQDQDDQTIIDDSDQAIRAFMQGRFVVPPVQHWTPPPPVESAPPKGASVVPALAPLCAAPHCQPVMFFPVSTLTERLKEISDAANSRKWLQVAAICTAQIQKYGLPPDPVLARCFLARVASLQQTKGQFVGQSLYDAFSYYKDAITNFPM